MSYTITVPASAPPAPSVESESVPIPQAYRRAKDFLLKVLRNELDHIRCTPNTDHTDSMLYQLGKEIGVKKVIENFSSQLVVYSRGAYPFNTPHNGNTLKWWTWLEKHPQANVLAVSSFFYIYRLSDNFYHRYLPSKYILLLLIQWPMNEQVQNLPGLIRHCEGIKMWKL